MQEERTINLKVKHLFFQHYQTFLIQLPEKYYQSNFTSKAILLKKYV